MGYAKINIWIRDRKTCGVVPISGGVSVTQCCGNAIAKGEISDGHLELTVPPGCYLVKAMLRGSKTVYETMVIVTCDKSACVNFLAGKEG